MTDPNRPTDAAVIANHGHRVTLIDGEEIVVRLTMENLLLIEERYGSLGDFQDKLTGWAGPESHRRPVFTEMVDAMAVCMPTEGLRDRLTLARLLAPERLGDYIGAAVAALSDAVFTGDQPPQDGPGNDPANPVDAQTETWPAPAELPSPWIPESFPGPSSTTPPPSYSDGPMPSSGG